MIRPQASEAGARSPEHGAQASSAVVVAVDSPSEVKSEGHWAFRTSGVALGL